MANPLLLDTHAWIWLEESPDKLSPQARSAIEEASGKGVLLVSVISIWEVAMLVAKQRVKPRLPIEEWVAQALATPGLTLVPLSPEIAIDSTRLPGEIHGDPADRILLATARRLGAALLTRDRRLLDYGRQRYAAIIPG